MISRILLPTIFLVLAYGFWVSPDFKEISAGVAIFLFGMLSLEEGFKAFTGGLLENLLRKTTNTLSKSVGFGIITTTLMQSSSLVSIITISFLSAGLISLAAGIGIIFGANLGTTTGAWLVAGFGLKVKISAYAMPMIVFGVILIFQKSKQLKGAGYVLTGLGFLFLGIHHMKEGFDAFKASIDLTAYAVSGYAGILLFTTIGLFATVVMQSSHATLVLIITALAAQQITYENALSLAIGANLGTTVTAMLGALGSNIEGRRLAAAHLIFNLVTAAVTIALLTPLMGWVDSLCAWFGIANDDYTLKLAMFHTLFNGMGILIMVPFTHQLVRLLEWMMQSKARSGTLPQYLHESSIGLPDTALEAVRQELLHLYHNAYSIIANTLHINGKALRSDKPLDTVIQLSQARETIDIDEHYNTSVKFLYGEIVAYISRVRPTMSKSQELTDELFRLHTAGRDIVEAVKETKHLQKNLEQHLTTSIPLVQEEYQQLRHHLATVLRELHTIERHEDSNSAILALDALKLDMQTRDAELTIRLEKLIRDGAITPQYAISLMNDSHYAYGITKKLVNMGTALFSDADLATKAIERDLALDAEELSSVNKSL